MLIAALKNPKAVQQSQQAGSPAIGAIAAASQAAYAPAGNLGTIVSQPVFSGNIRSGSKTNRYV